MKNEFSIPKSHPRYYSLKIREKLVEGFKKGIVATEGLIAQGRGETFDYILGEKTLEPARKAIRAAAVLLLLAKKPVISVNGNTACLVPKEIVKLANIIGAKIEVNLFYRTEEREKKIEKLLKSLGANIISGVGKDASAILPEIRSERRRVDPEGILIADLVFVALEDGDRTEALIKMGKKVIAVDLNPFSRTAQKATITIVDNIVRAMPILIKYCKYCQRFKKESKKKLRSILLNYDNKKILNEIIGIIQKKLA
jgi:4-phosphopantoate--beta-alanine ligase